jgi:hypothetical protein
LVGTISFRHHRRGDPTVVFENSFLNWTIQSPYLVEATSKYDRDKLALVLHSVPELDTIATESTLKSLLAVGYSVWMTGTSNYTELDAHFPVFVDRLAALLS